MANTEYFGARIKSTGKTIDVYKGFKVNNGELTGEVVYYEKDKGNRKSYNPDELTILYTITGVEEKPKTNKTTIVVIIGLLIIGLFVAFKSKLFKKKK